MHHWAIPESNERFVQLVLIRLVTANHFVRTTSTKIRALRILLDLEPVNQLSHNNGHLKPSKILSNACNTVSASVISKSILKEAILTAARAIRESTEAALSTINLRKRLRLAWIKYPALRLEFERLGIDIRIVAETIRPDAYFAALWKVLTIHCGATGQDRPRRLRWYGRIHATSLLDERAQIPAGLQIGAAFDVCR